MALIALARDARADERLRVSPSKQVETEAPTHIWYGSQTLTVDGLTFAFLLVGGTVVQRDLQTPVVFLGVMSYFFGPAFVHASHGRAGAMLVSPVLRAALPVAGGAVGHLFELSTAPSCDHCGPPDPGAIAIGGVILGFLGAITLDAAVLAYEAVEPSDPARPKPRRSLASAKVSPHIGISSQGLHVSASGVF